MVFLGTLGLGVSYSAVEDMNRAIDEDDPQAFADAQGDFAIGVTLVGMAISLPVGAIGGTAAFLAEGAIAGSFTAGVNAYARGSGAGEIFRDTVTGAVLGTATAGVFSGIARVGGPFVRNMTRGGWRRRLGGRMPTPGRTENNGLGLLPFVHSTPKKLAGPKVVNVFESVAADPRFLRIAGIGADEMATAVKSASIRYSNPLQGGYAGRIVTENAEELILGLSRFHARRSPAAHELFHLSRDLRSLRSLRMDKIPGPVGRLREEVIVWNMQFRYAPVRTGLELGGGIVFPVGGSIFGAWQLSQHVIAPLVHNALVAE